MTLAEDAIGAVQALMQQLQSARSAAQNAVSQTEKAQHMASALGDHRSVAMFNQVRDLIEQTHRTIGTALGTAEAAINRARSIAGG